MKKKIIFGLAIFALMFFFGGVYIVTTMETTIFDLHRLSQLHRTVAQRKELLLLIKKNQNNLTLRGTHFTMEDAPGENGLVATAKRCSACHHAPASPETLTKLQTEIEAYHELTREVFTTRPGSAVSEAKAEAALQLGDRLIRKMERIIAITGDNLDRQEREILQKMNQRIPRARLVHPGAGLRAHAGRRGADHRHRRPAHRPLGRLPQHDAGRHAARRLGPAGRVRDRPGRAARALRRPAGRWARDGRGRRRRRAGPRCAARRPVGRSGSR